MLATKGNVGGNIFTAQLFLSMIISSKRVIIVSNDPNSPISKFYVNFFCSILKSVGMIYG